MGYSIFISHSSRDPWVTRQISGIIQGFGASTFLDEADIDYGGDFEDKILEAVRASQELVVLLTPWALARRYIWLEIVAIWAWGEAWSAFCTDFHRTNSLLRMARRHC